MRSEILPSREPKPRRVDASAEAFRVFACRAAQRMGSPWAFLIATTVVLLWFVSGPIFHFNDAWQLSINTGTTIVTFLMVFLIQATQNRDATAIQLKLDELIRSSKARDVFAGLEDATTEELAAFKDEFRKLRQEGKRTEDAAVTAAERAIES